MRRARPGGCARSWTAPTARPPTSRRATWPVWKPTRTASSGAEAGVVAAAQVVVLHLPLQHVARDAERACGARDVPVVHLEHRGDVARFPRGTRGSQLVDLGRARGGR